MKELGHVAQIIVGVAVDSHGRIIPDRDRLRARDAIEMKYSGIHVQPGGHGSWFDARGRKVVEECVTYTRTGVVSLFEAEGIAKFLCQEHAQMTVILLYNGCGYEV